MDAARTAAIASIALLALGALVGGLALAWQQVQRARAGRVLERAIRASDAHAATPAAEPPLADTRQQQAVDSDLPLHWLDSRIGRALVAAEDRRLIAQCGLPLARAQWGYLVARVSLALLLPISALLLWGSSPTGSGRMTMAAVAFALGFMLPKWLLGTRAKSRKKAVARELPLFIDLLRLLQGVGLSMDQSLQVIGNDFSHVLKVLGAEVTIANRQYSRGRTREHSLQRLATLHDNESLANLVALLVQVDRHGGAVQEPLKQYGERLRENRRSAMKQHIGRVTVKMTGVMVLTLLPALLIITAGPGFLAVIHSLGAIAR